MVSLEDAVVFERRGAAGWARLSRPQTLNALDPAMIKGLQAAMELTASDPELRALVITGTGRAFCAGADLTFAQGPEAHAVTTAFLETVGETFNQLESFPKPVVAAVNGLAAGGGLELVLCCDLVVAADSAKLADAHANYGFLPGGGSSVRLPRKIGLNWAKYLLFTGQFVSAQDLWHAGLVNKVAAAGQLEQEVDQLVEVLAAKSPLGLRRMKQLVHDGLEQPVATAVRLESLATELHRRSEDNQEGVLAFREKRRPIFTGR